MNALVVANGTLPDTELLDPLLQGADLVVAADGGADLLLSRGLRLDAIVGGDLTLRHASRAEAGSPAAGSSTFHELEEADLLDRALAAQ